MPSRGPTISDLKALLDEAGVTYLKSKTKDYYLALCREHSLIDELPENEGPSEVRVIPRSAPRVSAIPTVKDLRALLDEAGIEYPKSSKKDQLVALCRENSLIEDRPSSTDKPVKVKTSETESKFKRALDILRPVGVTGKDAYMEICRLLVLKEVEKRYTEKLNDESLYDGVNFGDDEFGCLSDEAQIFDSQCFLFSKICEYSCESSPRSWETVGDVIRFLSKHREIGFVFKGLSEIHFLPVEQPAMKALLLFVRDELSFSSSFDVLGCGYESAFVLGSGKTEGQFFTPRMFVDYVVKMASDNRALGKVLDPACGTGGFLVRCKDAEELLGFDVETKIIPICAANVLLSTDTCFDVRRQNFLTYDRRKEYFDTIVANPPFGLKEKWSNIREGMPEDVYPFDTTCTGCFVSKMLWHLSVGGKLCIVFPLGNEMTSTDKKSVALRQALLKNCIVESITNLPSGVFSNTGVKCCVLEMTKVRGLEEEGEFATEVVKFLEMNDKGEVIERKTLTVEEMSEKSYSFSLASYLEVETGMEVGSLVRWVKLGDVCELKRGKSINKSCFVPGPYKVIGGGQTSMGFHDLCNTEKNCITISAIGAYAGFVNFHEESVFVTNNGSSLIFTEGSSKYLYYYLKSIQNKILKLQKGSGQPQLDADRFKELLIPLPPLELQNYIVSVLDKYSEGIIGAEKVIEMYQQRMKLILRVALKKVRERVKLGDVCELEKGKRLTKNNMVDGPYDVFSGGVKPIGKHNHYNTNENTLIVVTEASVGNVLYTREKIWLGDHAHRITTEQNERYLYHYLCTQKERLESFKVGATIQSIAQGLKELLIPLPPLEVQQALVDQLDSLQAEIQQLRSRIEEAKISMKEELEDCLMLEEVPEVSEREVEEEAISEEAAEESIEEE
jgi:restriction endonuclease S subunit/type I restriction-modification system DNA methylase subunit